MTRFDDTIHVTLAPSRCLRIASVVLHALAFVIAVILACSQPWFGVLAGVIVFSLWHADQRFGLKSVGVCTAFRWSADHQLQWRAHERGMASGRCIDARSWGAFWVRLKWRAEHRRMTQTIVIPADAVDADLHRRLRARCRVAPPLADS